MSLHDFPHFGPQGSHFCSLTEGHGGVHACPCGRLLEHSIEARRADMDSEDFGALLDLYN